MPEMPHFQSGQAGVDAGRSATELSLLDWIAANGGTTGRLPAAHHRLLLTELDRIALGSSDRLMVLMPPGSAKSSYASVLFPVWWFLRHPDSSVIVASHTASLASYFARQVRTLITDWSDQLGYSLQPSMRAAGEWRISTGGEYFASGIRGPIMGRRADLAIVDDPVKSQEEADSRKSRDRLWNWYRQELTTRLKPNARLVLIMTRWHEDDLAGRLLAHNSQQWRCLNLPALACSSDPLGRADEAPLWPDWEGQEALQRKREDIGERAWSAAFQQSPCNAAGSFFKVECIDVRDVPPAGGCRAVRAWDLAATDEMDGNDPDWSVGVKMLLDEAGRFFVEHVVRLRGSFNKVEQVLLETARVDGPSVTIGLPEDPGQAGKSQVGYLRRNLAGYVIASSKETGSKHTRAMAVASQVEGRNVSLLRGAWNYALLDELREFPSGRKDDQVDALSRAFHMLVAARAPARSMNVPYLAR